MRRPNGAATQEKSPKEGNANMMSLTPGAQIDELRRVLGESEQRRQAAEVRLADRERRLGTACRTIAAQDHRIGRLAAEVARLRGAAAPGPLSPIPPARSTPALTLPISNDHLYATATPGPHTPNNSQQTKRKCTNDAGH
jgi:hypothetical protein